MQITALVAYGSRHFLTNFLQEAPTPGTGPYFDNSTQSNVTGLVGKTVLLVCKVKNLGNRTVRGAFILLSVRQVERDVHPACPLGNGAGEPIREVII